MISQQMNETVAMRVDKWLWCARFYKTRAMASTAIKKGNIQVNDNPIKPAQALRPGDKIRIKSGPYHQQITVLALTKNRSSAQAAAQLYREDPSSIEKRRLLAEQLQTHHALYPYSQGRPTKHERRKLSAFKKRLS